LFIYFVLINTYKDFDLIVTVYPILWGLYLIWDWLKSLEHRDQSVAVWWSTPYLVVFIAIAVSWFTVARMGIVFSPWWMGWAELVILFVTIATYRVKQPKT
jgi:hypothetical protein